MPETEQEAPAEEVEQEALEAKADDAPLGPEGEKALDIWKQRAKAAEKAIKERDAELDTFRQAAMTEQERAIEQARREAAESARTETLTQVNERVLRAEIKAAAKGLLNDPADAFSFLDLAEFGVGEDGEIDTGGISDALTKLLESKPYLAAQSDQRFQGSADGGARKESGPSQLSRDDLTNMSPHEIEQARNEGRLTRLLGT